jgi:uncharacterized protein
MNSAALSPLQHLAALRWLLLSPPLVLAPNASTQLAQFSEAEQERIANWLTGLDADNSTLCEWTAMRGEVRIGRYAESLLAFYLAHGPVHRLVAAHIPIRSAVNGIKTTHGELDYLLTDTTGQRLHWELAVKFFLCTATGEIATPADFIGPNGVETLAHKWHKLFSKQLTHTPPPPWNEHAWRPQAFTRGWMFYRWDSSVPHCAALHPEHCKGWWIDWQNLDQLPEGRYAVLPRLQWVAPVTLTGSNAQAHSRETMAHHVRQLWVTGQQRATDAQMVVLLSDDLSKTHRIFVRP